MKRRLIAVLMMVAMLIAVGVHAATAGPPPASWERDNPARCPFPHQDRKPPLCDDLFYTPNSGINPSP